MLYETRYDDMVEIGPSCMILGAVQEETVRCGPEESNRVEIPLALPTAVPRADRSICQFVTLAYKRSMDNGEQTMCIDHHDWNGVNVRSSVRYLDTQKGTKNNQRCIPNVSHVTIT